MFRLLHLSDIHIGDTYKEPEEIACKIASDLVQHGLGKIQCIVVTGDIFEGTVTYSDELVLHAVNFFEVLLREINYNQESLPIGKEDILFVPGNHDIIRIKEQSHRWDKYHSFLSKFYGTIPSYYNTEDYSFFKTYNMHKIAFVGLNSCQIEQKKALDSAYISKLERNVSEEEFEKRGVKRSVVVDILKNQTANEYDDYGNIPLAQVTKIAREVKKLDNYTILALFHHHFYLFPEIAQKMGDSSLLRNHAEIVQQLKYMNVRMVLHGHKHFSLERPFITDDYYLSPQETIDVFAGGSVGTKRTNIHTFSVLDLYGRETDIKFIHNKFVYQDEKLEPIVRKQVPPHRAGGQIVRLLEILEAQNADLYFAYRNTADKVYKSYEDCKKIIGWVSEVLTGFPDTYKYLEDGGNNILFLLYAINLRTANYMKCMENNASDFKSAVLLWNDFYDTHLIRTGFSVQKEEYHRLFSFKKLQRIAEVCDTLLIQCPDKTSQVYLAFTMLGIFFTDLYLVFTHYADAFKEQIEYKVNIKIDENKFHENVPAPRILIKSDADRRTAYIELFCSDATAHKIAVLFVKEFDLLINKFEDYFKLIGLKLYYLLPRIDKDHMKNTVDNYNFEAYIPTLLPLLTGDNIYSSKLVFARELIQNSIDAIAVRSAKINEDFFKGIQIELGTDVRGKRYFKITDHGTGMDRYKIERYFTSIGRSFYSGKEYEELMIDYKPISNFGIGFLSSFMVCQEIDVKTKFYETGSEGLSLHIPNYDGCFFIERASDIPVGTEITLYLTCECTDSEIAAYIRNVMVDVEYDISIKILNRGKKTKSFFVPAHSIRKKANDELKLFVPFMEDGTVGKVEYLRDIQSDAYIQSYKCGLLMQKSESPKEKSPWSILNAGIRIKHAHPSILIGEHIGKNREFRTRDYQTVDVIANFPANWLQLDVSRDNVTSFSHTVQEHLIDSIAEQLYQQICQYIQYAEQNLVKTRCIDLQSFIHQTMLICRSGKEKKKSIYKNVEKLEYIVKIEYCNHSMRYSLTRKVYQTNQTNANIGIQVTREKASEGYASFSKKLLKAKLFAKYLQPAFQEIRQESLILEHELFRSEIFQKDSIESEQFVRHLIHSDDERLIDHLIHADDNRFFNYIVSSDADEKLKKFYAIASIVFFYLFEQSRESFLKYGHRFIYIIKKILLVRSYVGREQENTITVPYRDILELFSSFE